MLYHIILSFDKKTYRYQFIITQHERYKQKRISFDKQHETLDNEKKMMVS